MRGERPDREAGGHRVRGCATGPRSSRWPTSPGCAAAARRARRARAPAPYGTGEVIAAALDARLPRRRARDRRQRQHRRRRRHAAGARRPAARRRRRASCPTGGGALAGWPASTWTGWTRGWPRHVIVLASDVDNPLLGRRRRGRVRAAEGRGPARTSPCWSAAWRAGPTAELVDARRGRARRRDGRAPVRPAASGSPPWPCSARGCGRASSSCWSSWASPPHWPGRISSSPARARSTSRRSRQGPGRRGGRRPRAGVPVVTVCGVRDLDDAQLQAAGFAAAHALTEWCPDEAQCRADPGPLLETIGRTLA